MLFNRLRGKYQLKEKEMDKAKKMSVTALVLMLTAICVLPNIAYGKFTKEELEKIKQESERVKDIKINTFKKAMRAQDRNFTFYGKVVDLDGNPVPDATVKLNVSYFKPTAKFLSGRRDFEVKTDTKGLFSLKNKGRLLGISEIIKFGYDYKSVWELNRKNRRFMFERLDEDFEFKPDEPIVYHLRKRGEIAYIYKSGFTWHFRSDDNKPFRLKVLRTWMDADGFLHLDPDQHELNDHIEMSCKFNEDLTRYDLQFSWLGKDGGFFVNDTILYEAPSVTYKPDVSISGGMTRKDIKKYLYVQGDNGSFYSRIELDIRLWPATENMPKKARLMTVSSKIYTNPEGTRSLEYDPVYNSDEELHRINIDSRRGKAMREAQREKIPFDEKEFIKKIREEEKAKKPNS